MSRFEIHATPLEGLRVIVRKPLGDERGFLARMFCSAELSEAGWREPVAQINHTMTRRVGTVRGLHYQRAPHGEMKLVSCIRGRVWDVALDLRAGSPTLLRWHAEELSAANGRALLIPAGFAHGFQALEPDVELLYLHSAAHVAASEGGIDALDPRLGISWPGPVTERSARDGSHPPLPADFGGLSA